MSFCADVRGRAFFFVACLSEHVLARLSLVLLLFVPTSDCFPSLQAFFFVLIFFLECLSKTH